ncbi:lysozyme [Sarracenia purpurea var. burkii]
MLAKHFGKDTLSPNEWRPFWIQLSPDGSIRVENDEDGNSPFLSWKREQRMPIDKFESASYKISIDHFAFSSFNTTVDWAFRCPKKHSKDLTECTKLRTTKYEYDVTYSIDDYIQNETTIFLPFYVKAEKEAHITLSPTSERAVVGKRAYEIFLGGYGGDVAGIRDVRGSLAKIKRREYNILSPDEWRPFWIRISPNGLIEVGKEIGSRAFMSWKAELPVDYYSVASYDNGTIDWAIECPKRKLRSEHV